MEVGVDNWVMEFPAVDGEELSSPPSLPPRLRRRLTETKSSPSTAQDIEAKLRHADLRRQVLIIINLSNSGSSCFSFFW